MRIVRGDTGAIGALADCMCWRAAMVYGDTRCADDDAPEAGAAAPAGGAPVAAVPAAPAVRPAASNVDASSGFTSD